MPGPARNGSKRRPPHGPGRGLTEASASVRGGVCPGSRRLGERETTLRTYVCEPLPEKAIEHLMLAVRPGGFTADGLIVHFLPLGPIRLHSRVTGDRQWRAMRVTAEVIGVPRRRLEVTTDTDGVVDYHGQWRRLLAREAVRDRRR